jgi:hypothetical protein
MAPITAPPTPFPRPAPGGQAPALPATSPPGWLRRGMRGFWRRAYECAEWPERVVPYC